MTPQVSFPLPEDVKRHRRKDSQGTFSHKNIPGPIGPEVHFKIDNMEIHRNPMNYVFLFEDKLLSYVFQALENKIENHSLLFLQVDI